MSLTAVRPYFVARGKQVGLSEHLDAFNVENIASTVIDKSFHVEMGVGTGVRLNMTDQEIDQPVTVRIFRKGFRNAQQGLDLVIAESEKYIKAAVDQTKSLTGELKNVRLDTIVYESLAQSNDNIAVARVEFTALVILGLQDTN